MEREAVVLLDSARSFDPRKWATDLQTRSPARDLALRIHVASAHRAAVCIYLSRILLSIMPTRQLPIDLEHWVAEIIHHLSFIRPSDALFTATTWPAFVAGAETNDCARQKWVVVRFGELWQVEPWGLLRGGLEVLESIWDRKRRRAMVHSEGIFVEKSPGPDDWIRDLRERGVDWMII